MKTVFLSRPAGALKRSIATLCAAALLVQPVATAAAEVTTTYTYDEARTGAHNIGQLTSVSNDAATIRYDHDERGNVTSQRWEVDGTTYTQTFTYAPHDEILRRTFADGDVTPSASGTYQYDGAGLLKSIPGLITDVSRNANFNPITTTYGNGVTETRNYDPNRQWLLSITAQSGQTTLFEESYTRSDKGLITDVVSNRAKGDWQYGYDTADRLTSATNLNDALLSQTYQYDAADNLTFNSAVGTYTYPAPAAPQPHAVQQAGGQTYTYDLNGNMIAGAGRTITYDGEDRPVSITSNGQTTDFVYGPDGARLKKTTGGNTTLYLGADEEISPDGTHIKHPLSDVRKSGSDINWMHRDHLSSVKLMSDTGGAVISENFYKPYGERSDVQMTPPGTPRESKGWIGERDDPETGLMYLNARYYDPVLARFISPDWFEPKKVGVGTNRYAYALNNPIWLKDPGGNDSFGSGNPYGGYDIDGDGYSQHVGGWNHDINNNVSFRDGSRDKAGYGGRFDDNLRYDPTNTSAHTATRSVNDISSNFGMDSVSGGGGFAKASAEQIITSNSDAYLGVPLLYGGIAAAAATPYVASVVGPAAVSTPGAIGRAGEASVRAAYNIGAKVRVPINGRIRIPDGMTSTTITEVKNVSRLSFSSQLRDYVAIARNKSLRFDLFVRGPKHARPTQLSKPLEDAIRRGLINPRYIPGTF